MKIKLLDLFLRVKMVWSNLNLKNNLKRTNTYKHVTCNKLDHILILLSFLYIEQGNSIYMQYPG